MLNKRSAEQVKRLMLGVLRRNVDWIPNEKLQEWCGRIDANMKKQILEISDREEGGWDDLPTDMLAISYLELWALKIQGGYLFYRNPAQNGQYQRMAGGELWSKSFVSGLAWISTARNPPNACFVPSPSLSWDLNEIC